MNVWIMTSVIIMNLLSVIGFVVIRREINHLVGSHTHILGRKNEELINSFQLKILRTVYLLVVLFLIIFSLYVFVIFV